MLSWSALLLGLIASPSGPPGRDTARTSARHAPTIEHARAGLSPIHSMPTLPEQFTPHRSQRSGALIGAGVLGTLGLITSLAYVESEGGGAGKMIVFTAGSAFVGFILGAIVAGTGK